MYKYMCIYMYTYVYIYTHMRYYYHYIWWYVFVVPMINMHAFVQMPQHETCYGRIDPDAKWTFRIIERKIRKNFFLRHFPSFCFFFFPRYWYIEIVIVGKFSACYFTIDFRNVLMYPAVFWRGLRLSF